MIGDRATVAAESIGRWFGNLSDGRIGIGRATVFTKRGLSRYAVTTLEISRDVERNAFLIGVDAGAFGLVKPSMTKEQAQAVPPA